VADGMLGKLARWLRMLGYDVAYSNNYADGQLLEIAVAEDRVLLTHDLELYQHAAVKGICAHYLQGETGEQKLAELARRFSVKLQIDMSTSRCPKCNTPVSPTVRSKVAGRVEKSTFDNYEQFWECPKCGQIYWQGAHWTRIQKSLQLAERILQEKEIG